MYKRQESVRKVKVVLIGSHHTQCAQLAEVEIPLLTVFEKSGTLVNQQFRVQKFAQAVPGPAGTLHGLSTFTRILQALNPDAVMEPSPAIIWDEMQNLVPEFAGMKFEAIPSTGTVVGDERFANLPFVETQGLHFEPKAALAEA